MVCRILEDFLDHMDSTRPREAGNVLDKADSERETFMKILCLNNVSSMVSSQSHPLSHITAHIVLTGQARGRKICCASCPDGISDSWSITPC